MDRLPKDPVILLSYVNTQLRDFYASLDEFCDEKGAERDSVEAVIRSAGYVYDPEKNQFV